MDRIFKRCCSSKENETGEKEVKKTKDQREEKR